MAHSSYRNLSEKRIKTARSKPGGSNAYSYNKNNIFAGPNDTYPLTKDGSKTLDPERVRAAARLAGHASNPNAVRKSIARIAINKGNKQMATLGKHILERMKKRKGSKWGGNKGDESSSKVDYKDDKHTDKGYKSKAFGEAGGDRSKSRRDYVRRGK